VERDLRTGTSLEVALGRHTKLTGMDLSLLRAGAKSGTLPRMFGFLADGYDARLRDLIKRITALIEPLAIGGIAVLVGAVALSLVLALTSVYENIS
jgi:type II secretory pathway component PulF